MQVQFSKDIADMGFDRGFTDKKAGRNLFIGHAPAQKFYDLPFPVTDTFITQVVGETGSCRRFKGRENRLIYI